MGRRKKRNRHDKYGIYEIPNYNVKTYGRKKKRKKKPASLKGVLKLFLAIWILILLFYAVSYGVKYSMKNEAISLYVDKDYQGAADLFKEALKPRLPLLEEFDNDVRFYLADCYINLGDYELACVEYGKIRLWSGKNSRKTDDQENIARGLLLYKEMNYKQALPILKKAYEDGYGELVLYVGSCYGQVGDLDNMQLYYNVFLQQHNMNSFMYAQYASIALDEGELDKALEYIESGMELDDRSSIKELLYDEIVYYEKIKDYNTAFEKAEKYIEDGEFAPGSMLPKVKAAARRAASETIYF